MAGIAPPVAFEEFRRLASLGSGGMGEVWLFEDVDLHRTVALKFIADPAPDDRSRERFLTEGQALAQIAHPNVLTVHRVGEVGGRPYLMTEFVRGTPLSSLPAPVPRANLLELSLGLSRGLLAAHQRGILHRDIKPSNAIVPEKAAGKEDPAGRRLDFANVKLLDFGLAKFLDAAPGTLSSDQSGDGMTNPGAVLGTPLYMAPECRRGERASARSDLYSLGAVLYDLCTGAPPNPTRTTRELCASDPGLGRIVDRCLRENPAERFASAEELHTALLRLDPRGRHPLEGNPYRGLRPFDEEHRAVFFGRGLEADEILHRLREERFVLVAGDSGVGKSSLCRAGVVPRVREGEIDPSGRACVLRLVPGRHPLRALAEAIAPLRGHDAEAIEPWLRSDPAALPRALPPIPGVSLILLFADQLEELLTVADRREAEDFAAALVALCASNVPARILGTVRGDFFTRLAALPRLGDLVPDALFVLRPMRRDSLRKTVIEPARASGAEFESPETIDVLVAEAEDAPGGLPLLQFTMAELWEVRDPETQRIPAEAVQRLGGVAGALARHADELLERLLPEQQAAARRVLVQLVTPEGTRNRASAAELTRDRTDSASTHALEALVHGRLVVAHKSDGGATEYEVAHEALLTRWHRLRDWLEADGDRRQIRKRIEGAAKEWERLGRPGDALWDRRHLREAARVDRAELDPLHLAFLDASSRRGRRAKQTRLLLIAAGPLLAMLVVGGARWRARAEIGARAGERWTRAAASLAEARRLDERASRSREEALVAYSQSKTAEDWARAEKGWGAVLEQRRSADSTYQAAEITFASALAIDPLHEPARTQVADALFFRARLAQRFGDLRAFSDLLQRLAALPQAGQAAILATPARLTIDVDPPGTAVSIAPFATVSGRTRPSQPRLLGSSPLGSEVAPGSYLLLFRDAKSREFRLPLLLDGGESITVAFRIPEVVPEGYVFVPPGRFLTGFSEDERLRRALNAPPAHEAATGAYFIARHEVTFEEYVAFLDTLTGADRGRRVPRHESNLGSLELRESRAGWELTLQPTTHRLRAVWGEPIRYPKRQALAVQDWRRFPVAAISLQDAQAYSRWLSLHGLPGAHVCDDREWERAARGADGRDFTTGETLLASDVNIDETYGREPSSFGPDEVGSHPASDSVFGVQDMVGNAMEMVISVEGFDAASIRGGSWYYDEWSARLPARFPLDKTTRSPMVGFRICAPIDATGRGNP